MEGGCREVVKRVWVDVVHKKRSRPLIKRFKLLSLFG